MKVLIPQTIDDDVTTKLDRATVVYYDVDQEIPEQHRDAEALVVWGNSAEQLSRCALQLRSLRWVQTLAAGPDTVLDAGFAQDVIITAGRSLHDGPVAEHTLALCLAAARRLHLTGRAQIGRRWAGEVGGRQPLHDPEALTTLRGARVVVWGFGSIAKTLTPLLQLLGATVTGVATTASRWGDVRVAAPDEVDSLLPDTDMLIMLLPAIASTAGALSADRIALLPRRSWLVNAGRGSVVDEPALIQALAAGRLGGAALDVTAVEPLPVDSPLWGLDNVIVTPHAAGGRPVGASQLVADNAERLRSGEQLRNVVSRDQ